VYEVSGSEVVAGPFEDVVLLAQQDQLVFGAHLVEDVEDRPGALRIGLHGAVV
jgi:hypothetical protein